MNPEIAFSRLLMALEEATREDKLSWHRGNNKHIFAELASDLKFNGKKVDVEIHENPFMPGRFFIELSRNVTSEYTPGRYQITWKQIIWSNRDGYGSDCVKSLAEEIDASWRREAERWLKEREIEGPLIATNKEAVAVAEELVSQLKKASDGA